ncbi:MULTISPECIES: DUF7344 domain-containing protein [Salinibaculum]|uniref:DUF7344 domain-containing protein n=1 Tax=Salinibaculum TaxID=2732368 RepID=UPI0030CF1A08
MASSNETAGAPRLAGQGMDATDELFDQLSHPVRRDVLVELLRADPGAEVHISEFARSDRGRSSLYHTHFPRLAAAGYIEWDRRTDTIAAGPRFETVTPVLELLVAHSNRLPADLR